MWSQLAADDLNEQTVIFLYLGLMHATRRKLNGVMAKIAHCVTK